MHFGRRRKWEREEREERGERGERSHRERAEPAWRSRCEHNRIATALARLAMTLSRNTLNTERNHGIEQTDHSLSLVR
jgi:hypothetical protein